MRRLMLYGLEALILLALVKLKLGCLPYKAWRFKNGIFQCETLKENIAEDQVQAISRSIMYMAKHLPWKSKCLDQAMVAQKMLTRRGLPVTLYLGMLKNEKSLWGAHAWVRCGERWVVGYHPEINYTVVGTYAWIK